MGGSGGTGLARPQKRWLIVKRKETINLNSPFRVTACGTPQAPFLSLDAQRAADRNGGDGMGLFFFDNGKVQVTGLEVAKAVGDGAEHDRVAFLKRYGATDGFF